MKELIITRQPGTKFGAGFRIANFANLSKWLQTDFHLRRRELITRFNCSYVKILAWYTWLASFFLEESRPGFLQQSPMNTAPVLAAGSEPSRSLVLWTESHGSVSTKHNIQGPLASLSCVTTPHRKWRQYQQSGDLEHRHGGVIFKKFKDFYD